MQHAADNLADVSHILLVASGKGGTGKSTTVARLAYHFNAMGQQVGIFDADVLGPSIPHLTGAKELTVEDEGTILPAVVTDIKVASCGMIAGLDTQPAILRGPMASRIVMELLEGVCWGNLDVLLVDLPPGSGDIPLSIAQRLSSPTPKACIVTTPQSLAVDEADKAIAMCHTLEIPVVGLVENMSYFQPPDSHEPCYIFGCDRGKALADRYGIPFCGQVPIIPIYDEYTAQGKIWNLPANHPDTRISHEAHERVARKLLRSMENGECEEHGLGSFRLQWHSSNPSK